MNKNTTHKKSTKKTAPTSVWVLTIQEKHGDENTLVSIHPSVEECCKEIRNYYTEQEFSGIETVMGYIKQYQNCIDDCHHLYLQIDECVNQKVDAKFAKKYRKNH